MTGLNDGHIPVGKRHKKLSDPQTTKVVEHIVKNRKKKVRSSRRRLTDEQLRLAEVHRKQNRRRRRGTFHHALFGSFGTGGKVEPQTAPPAQ